VNLVLIRFLARSWVFKKTCKNPALEVGFRFSFFVKQARQFTLFLNYCVLALAGVMCCTVLYAYCICVRATP